MDGNNGEDDDENDCTSKIQQPELIRTLAVVVQKKDRGRRRRLVIVLIRTGTMAFVYTIMIYYRERMVKDREIFLYVSDGGTENRRKQKTFFHGLTGS